MGVLCVVFVGDVFEYVVVMCGDVVGLVVFDFVLWIVG